MAQLPRQLTWAQASPRWASQLDPILANPATNPGLLPNIQLIAGVNVIPHKLGQVMQGWKPYDIQGPAVIYRSAPFNNLTLTLTSSAAVTISLEVF